MPLKTYPTPSATFKIPEWLGDYTAPDIEQIEEQAREEEAAAAYEWVMREAEYQRMETEKRF